MSPNQPADEVDALRQFDAICDSFERQWRTGEKPRIADFLERVPQSQRNELAMQLLDVEWEARIARGECPRIEEAVHEYPALADWIPQRLNQLLETVSQGQPTVVLPGPQAPHAKESVEDVAGPILGRRFGKYELVELLGMGGMGAVYRARHTMVKSERALKLLHPTLARRPDAIQRFLVEAQACIELSHPNLVTTYHVDQEQDGTIYIVMELLHGENLHQLVNRTGPLPVHQAATILQQAAAGLAFVHGRGAIHRDVKPHNIMWTLSGVAKILDLGLARILDEEPIDVSPEIDDEPGSHDLLLTQFHTRLTREDALLGTLPYMAPEQAADARHADGRSDIYSLGCTFYYLLTGKHAFAGGSVEEILDRHLSAQFAPLADYRRDVPAPLSSILDRMMTKDRDQRYSSAQAIVAAVQEWLDHPDGIRHSVPERVEPVSLEDPKQLRGELVRLRVISPEDWDQAEEAARRRRVSSFDPVSSSVLLDRPLPLQSTHVLEELQRRPGNAEEWKHGLSEFQIQYVLNGDQDLLRLPHHVLVDQIGSGWKGDVFKARNIEADRLEAVRTFSPRALQSLDGSDTQRTTAFLALVDRLADFEHPGIPRVYGGGRCENRRHGQQVYLATQFIHGITLHELVHQGGAPRGESADVAWCLRTTREVCYALEYAHQRGVLHLDVHGLSLKVDGTGRVFLLDLGVPLLLTRRLSDATKRRWRGGASASADGSVQPSSGGGLVRATISVEPPPLGTPTVMPPEQWQNRSHVSVATDIYNLACTMFFMLTGQYPFQASSALDAMRQHLEKPPMSDPAAKRIPQPLRPILEKALAKSPENRFHSARAMGQALDECLANPALTSATDSEVRPTWLSRILQWVTGKS